MHEVRLLTSTLRSFALPQDLAHLFEIESKKEAERFAERELVLKDSDFVNLIMGAENFGFFHRRKHREFVPAHLGKINPNNIGNADSKTGPLTKEGKKEFRKIAEIFRQRRQLSVHWFEFGFEWHCFFFDGGDLLGGHWSAGDHIHYLSHLWGIPGTQVWEGFDARDFSPAKAHIRYAHNMRDR